MVSPTRVRDQRGVATVLGMAMITLLCFLAGLGVTVNVLISSHRQAQAAADLAALAAAAAQVDGRDACASAGRIAGQNRAQLTSCRPTESSVVVEVTTRSLGLFGAEQEVRARARAGQGGLDP